MTSRERVRAAYTFQKPDRVPAAFEAVGSVQDKLVRHYGYDSADRLIDRFGIDIVPIAPNYIGPELPTRLDAEGRQVSTSWWGFETTRYETSVDAYGITTYFPMNNVKTVEDVEKCRFPDPDWFDYASLRAQCDRWPDKATILGHEGPFQFVTFLMEMGRFFLLMVDAPEAAQLLLDRMVDFELEYYRRCFEAVPGRIDILRPHDDYGTQISLLFSVPMWRQFFERNTRRLAELAHRYGAFYQQHSCGAVGSLIPEFIRCGVDALEPLQKVKGLEIDRLAELYGGRIVFHGGVDTQGLLPNGTPAEVGAETRHILCTLGRHGGYVLMASQGFEGDVPIENIEAVYAADRRV